MSDDAFTQTTRILRVLLDEYKAPPMALVALANVRKIEAGWQELRARIATLESERDALRAQVDADSTRYAAAVAEWDAARGRLTERAEKAEAERDLLMKDTGARLDGYRELGAQTAAALNERDQARLGERDALATAARLRAELEGARGKALEEAAMVCEKVALAYHHEGHPFGDESGQTCANGVRALAAQGG